MEKFAAGAVLEVDLPIGAGGGEAWRLDPRKSQQRDEGVAAKF